MNDDPGRSPGGAPPAAPATPSIEDLLAPREGAPADLPRDDVPPMGTNQPPDAPPPGNQPDPDGPDEGTDPEADTPDAPGLAESPGPGDAPPLG
ncbi:MAG: hypothetical protein U0869_08635 [Chloroflexota bacterium]